MGHRTSGTGRLRESGAKIISGMTQTALHLFFYFYQKCMFIVYVALKCGLVETLDLVLAIKGSSEREPSVLMRRCGNVEQIIVLY